MAIAKRGFYRKRGSKAKGKDFLCKAEKIRGNSLCFRAGLEPRRYKARIATSKAALMLASRNTFQLLFPKKHAYALLFGSPEKRATLGIRPRAAGDWICKKRTNVRDGIANEVSVTNSNGTSHLDRDSEGRNAKKEKICGFAYLLFLLVTPSCRMVEVTGATR